MQVRLEDRDGALVVTPLVARLDALSALEFRDAVVPSVRGRLLVVVSLAHVEHVDPSGLAALVAILKQLPPGGEVRLVAVRPPVRALLDRTHLDEVFRADAAPPPLPV